MPYCSHCGNQVTDRDVYCAHCGSRQPVPPAPTADYLSGVSPRAAALLCYIPVVGWIAAIVVLASARFRNDRAVRFHAFQGLYLFVAWLLIRSVISPMSGFIRHDLFHPLPIFLPVGLLQLAVLVAWIFMMVKANQGEAYHLPIFGELAERSVAEQK